MPTIKASKEAEILVEQKLHAGIRTPRSRSDSPQSFLGGAD
jgi:hypothetical protein